MINKKRIILDTNFLMIPAQFKVDIFSEIDRICTFRYEICILDKTVEELEKIIKEQKGRNRDAAKLALQLLKKKDLKIVPTASKRSADELLIELADSNNIIATQDMAVRRAAKLKSAEIIFLKNKRYLKLE